MECYDGETSWDAPGVLAQPTGEMSEEKAIGDTVEKRDADMGTIQSSAPLGTKEDDFTREFSVDTKFNTETNVCVDSGKKDDGSNDGCGRYTFKVEEEYRDETRDQGTSLLGEHSVGSDNATDLSLQLITQCENLLERLNSVKGYGTCNFWL